MPRPLARFLRVSVAVLVLTELLLQVGALVVALTFAPDPETEVDEDKHRILCLGDSFTFGIGAADREQGSYPAQLQSILDQRAEGRFQVVNRGWPGFNSQRILSYLPRDLAEVRPQTVVVLCGVNDRWSSPEKLDLRDRADFRGPARGFRWRFRTRLLVQLIVDALRSAGSSIDVDAEVAAAEGAEDAVAGLGHAVEAFAGGGDGDWLRQFVRERREELPVVRLKEVFAGDLQVWDADREEATGIVADELGYEQRGFHWRKRGTEQWITVVEPTLLEGGEAFRGVVDTWNFHLTQIVERCREAGAEVMFLTYPHQFEIPGPPGEPPARPAFPTWARTLTFPPGPAERLGAELGVPVLRTLEPMQARAEGRDETELFVPDAHCTALGYRVFAELVADQLLQ